MMVKHCAYPFCPVSVEGRASKEKELPGEEDGNDAPRIAKPPAQVTSNTNPTIKVRPKENITGNFSGNTGSRNMMTHSHHNNPVLHASVHYHAPPLQVKRIGPTTFWMVTPSWNEGFTGRVVIIEKLRDLSMGGLHNRIALLGMGGVGKTQIALQYSYWCRGKRPVFWVSGSNFLRFSEDFKEIAQYAPITLNEDDPNEKQLMVVKRWLEGPNCGNWLLIVDNADNETDFADNSSVIARFLPHGPQGMMVVTTRSRKVANRLGCEAVRVNKMTVDEAKSLFLRHCDVPNIEEEEEDALLEILELLDCIPLGIVGAAAYMTQTETLAHEYLAIFKNRDQSRRHLLSQGLNDSHKGYKQDLENILSVFFITFERLVQQMPVAAQVLFLIAFLDHQNIPEELVLESELEGADPVEYQDAIRKLCDFSLVSKITTLRTKKPVYELHYLVQLSIRAYLDREKLVSWRGQALHVVERLFPVFDHRVQGDCRVYLPHAVAVLEGSQGYLVDPLSDRIWDYLYHSSNYISAEMHIRWCIAAREKRDELDTWYWKNIDRLVLILRLTGRRQDQESQVLTRRVQNNREAALRPDPLDTHSGYTGMPVVPDTEAALEPEQPGPGSNPISVLGLLILTGMWLL
ncbi:P-loop containing nucleoside triphosphate hydrolase protein [Tuber borchii]|uniref:P-loop containing nucleoside triphosphate hydrolase protein n=1 Tax=Tuber borchii TaxID=42251 RepID=A0A2T6ZPY9_TUBBO|nr:P-loop containing nucleoside triphosphate hydrolase protein [Tuber borchii]